MLTCVSTLAGFLLVLGIGGYIVEHGPVSRWLDSIADDFPINWERDD